MGLVLNPSKVESWGKSSKSKGRKKKDEAVEEHGCWVKLRFGTCMPSRSKVNSSITGTSGSGIEDWVGAEYRKERWVCGGGWVQRRERREGREEGGRGGKEQPRKNKNKNSFWA
ncbi:hypothetical protein ACFX11_003100 [Malus domestica]